MSADDSRKPSSPLQPPQLLLTRIIWAFLLIEMLGIAVAVTAIPTPPENDTQAATLGYWLYQGSFVALGVMVPLAYFIRNQIYKRHWRADVVAPEGYFVANLVFFGLLEAPALLSAVGAFLAGRAWPHLLTLGVVILVTLVNYPHGRPMQAHAPRIGDG